MRLGLMRLQVFSFRVVGAVTILILAAVLILALPALAFDFLDAPLGVADADDLYADSDCALDLGKVAIQSCSQLINSERQSGTRDELLAILYVYRGDAYEFNRERDRAILDYDKAIELNPKFAKAYEGRGDAYLWKHDYDRAIADYDKAIELSPKTAKPYEGRGDAYLWKDDYDRAIADYDKVIQLRSNDKDSIWSFLAYVARGDVYRTKSDYDRAIASYNKAIELSPKAAKTYGHRGDAYFAKDDHDRAIANYHKAIQLNPKYFGSANTQSIQGIWKGNYVCAQGLTGLTLLIEGDEPSQLTARFMFYAVPENPGVPSGELGMIGKFDPSVRRLDLRPEKWIRRPSGYATVGLSGTIDPKAQTFTGRLPVTGCQTFELSRILPAAVPQQAAQISSVNAKRTKQDDELFLQKQWAVLCDAKNTEDRISSFCKTRFKEPNLSTSLALGLLLFEKGNYAAAMSLYDMAARMGNTFSYLYLARIPKIDVVIDHWQKKYTGNDTVRAISKDSAFGEMWNLANCRLSRILNAKAALDPASEDGVFDQKDYQDEQRISTDCIRIMTQHIHSGRQFSVAEQIIENSDTIVLTRIFEDLVDENSPSLGILGIVQQARKLGEFRLVVKISKVLAGAGDFYEISKPYWTAPYSNFRNIKSSDPDRVAKAMKRKEFIFEMARAYVDDKNNQIPCGMVGADWLITVGMIAALAQQGEAEAQLLLGKLMASDHKCSRHRDMAEADYWYEKASRSRCNDIRALISSGAVNFADVKTADKRLGATGDRDTKLKYFGANRCTISYLALFTTDLYCRYDISPDETLNEIKGRVQSWGKLVSECLTPKPNKLTDVWSEDFYSRYEKTPIKKLFEKNSFYAAGRESFELVEPYSALLSAEIEVEAPKTKYITFAFEKMTDNSHVVSPLKRVGDSIECAFLAPVVVSSENKSIFERRALKIGVVKNWAADFMLEKFTHIFPNIKLIRAAMPKRELPIALAKGIIDVAIGDCKDIRDNPKAFFKTFENLNVWTMNYDNAELMPTTLENYQ
jgi:tetratricopeptide (TPR) repeat protein